MEDTVLTLIDERVLQIAAKLTELGEQYGPDVVDAALMVVRIDAGQEILISIVWLILAVVGYRYSRWAWPRIPDWNDPTFQNVSALLSVTAIPLGLLISALGFVQIWTWVAIFDPKLAVAKRILDGVL